MTDTLLGVDVSHWQGKMDWKQAKAAGVQFAFIKATEGSTYTDPQLMANVDGCKMQGIPYAIYHFWRDNVAPNNQYTNISKAYNQAYKPPIVIDVEAYPSGLGAVENTQRLVDLINLIYNNTKQLPTIYTSKSKWDSYITPFKKFVELPLWVANYGVTSPAMPRDWTFWHVWQYTSQGNGAKHGAQSQFIDLNYVKPAYLEYYSIGQVQPEPEPIPVPTMPEILTEIIINGVKYTGEMRR